MLSTEALQDWFAQGLSFDAYVRAAKPHEMGGWKAFTERVELRHTQVELIRSFNRRMNVICLSGSWCGDCVQQCPMLHRIAAAHPAAQAAASAGGIDLRFLERDAYPDLAEATRICGGQRVPVVIFMNEDCEFVALAGDRTISRYRAIAARALGPSCPLPGAPVPPDEIAATLADWLLEFERVALLLRLSPKLRHRYAD